MLLREEIEAAPGELFGRGHSAENMRNCIKQLLCASNSHLQLEQLCCLQELQQVILPPSLLQAFQHIGCTVNAEDTVVYTWHTMRREPSELTPSDMRVAALLLGQIKIFATSSVDEEGRLVRRKSYTTQSPEFQELKTYIAKRIYGDKPVLKVEALPTTPLLGPPDEESVCSLCQIL